MYNKKLIVTFLACAAAVLGTGCDQREDNLNCNPLDSVENRILSAQVVIDNIDNFALSYERRERLLSNKIFADPTTDMKKPSNARSWHFGYSKIENMYWVLFMLDPKDKQSFQVECKVKCFKLIENCQSVGTI